MGQTDSDATGAVASNPYRFSTKPLDVGSGLYYYGYRYYNPIDGRWINRDPIEEQGGVNLYSSMQNNPIADIDAKGLFSYWEAIAHFFNSGGLTKIIAFSEIDNGIHPADFPGFDDVISEACPCSKRSVNLTSLNQNVGGGPGRITFQLSGSVQADGFGWSFSGEIRANDEEFDFNWLPWGVRTWYNEIFTRVGGAIGHGLRGHDFLMRFYGSRKASFSGSCGK